MSDKMSYVDVIKYTLNKLTIVLFIMGLLILAMFSYVNTLFYSLSLLVVVLLLLYSLVSHLMLHTLTMLILLIVYVGAIMILIGYICAVCPNIILAPKRFRYSLYLFYSLFYTLFCSLDCSMNSLDLFSPITSYFYSLDGVLMFRTIVFMLFVTLLIVTSQYVIPKGPFRSVSI